MVLMITDLTRVSLLFAFKSFKSERIQGKPNENVFVSLSVLLLHVRIAVTSDPWPAQGSALTRGLMVEYFYSYFLEIFDKFCEILLVVSFAYDF
jgi:hypothetical protein